MINLTRKKLLVGYSYSVFKYSGNTTNLTDHHKRKQPTFALTEHSQVKSKPHQPSSSSINIQPPKSGETKFQSIDGTSKLSPKSRRSKEITATLVQFIGKDLRPYSVVENSGFKNLIKVLKPKYGIPSRPHFSEKVIPELYTKS